MGRERAPAAAHWARALAGWAIPARILAAAEGSPYGFDVGRFVRAAEEAAGQATPSRDRAVEALPPSGSVLDVGCGAGAAGLALAPPAGHVVGVDPSAAMLEAFASRAEALGVDHGEVRGSWPDVAGGVEPADVVVCHHVVYNVADLGPFFAALTGRARALVVVELTAEHPMAWTRPLWRALHWLDRPFEPLAGDAVAVARELGLEPSVERWDKTFAVDVTGGEDQVAVVRRRLCLPATQEADVAWALERWPPPERRAVVTLTWPGGGADPGAARRW
jgi:SAM-dependent methyltransferase